MTRPISLVFSHPSTSVSFANFAAGQRASVLADLVEVFYVCHENLPFRKEPDRLVRASGVDREPSPGDARSYLAIRRYPPFYTVATLLKSDPYRTLPGPVPDPTADISREKRGFPRGKTVLPDRRSCL